MIPICFIKIFPNFLGIVIVTVGLSGFHYNWTEEAFIFVAEYTGGRYAFFFTETSEAFEICGLFWGFPNGIFIVVNLSLV
jgi:uncharacterized membrane protein